MLARQNRLRSSRSFRTVYEQGRSWAHPAAVLYTLPQSPPLKEIGVTASKKLGGAVVRNRARRRLKAICRQWEPWIPPGVRMVLVARPPAVTLSPPALTEAL